MVQTKQGLRCLASSVNCKYLEILPKPWWWVACDINIFWAHFCWSFYASSLILNHCSQVCPHAFLFLIHKNNSFVYVTANLKLYHPQKITSGMVKTFNFCFKTWKSIGAFFSESSSKCICKVLHCKKIVILISLMSIRCLPSSLLQKLHQPLFVPDHDVFPQRPKCPCSSWIKCFAETSPWTY